MDVFTKRSAMAHNTALQINLHPFDARIVEHTLEHQLRALSPMVERIVVTVDTRRSRSGRYSGAGYEMARAALFAKIEAARRRYPKMEMIPVDYSPAALEAVRRRYFRNLPRTPERAYDGGPFHAYFFGLLSAGTRYVLHVDGDMMLGGGSRTWIDEAIATFETNPDALFVGPLPGPPRADGSLGEGEPMPNLRDLPEILRLDTPYPAYAFSSVSTRVFMIDHERFDQRIGSLSLVRPSLRQRIRARLFHQRPDCVAAEEMLSHAMLARGLARIDFLGQGGGLYSLHPPYRSETFYQQLPHIIRRVETGMIPAGQRGFYDLNESMIDWNDARRQRTVYHRAVRAARGLLAI